MRALGAAAAAAVSGLLMQTAEPVESIVASGDAHYGRRSEGHRGGIADPREITDAIAAYSVAAAREPDNAAVRWKLARALYFLGTYTGLDEKGQRAAFLRGKTAGEEALDAVARRGSKRPRTGLAPAELASLLRNDPDAAASLFWAAVDWGQWGLATNKMDAAASGVAHRVRDYCLALIAFDPEFEEGGGYRILGRLHDRAPKIPLVTGWVSRAEALRYLKLAAGVAPGNLVNLQFLAEAQAAAGNSSEARSLEERVVAATLSPDHLVEELAIQEAARANLALWQSQSKSKSAPAHPP